ncbi:MAG: hypothetical protein ACP5GX_01565 [Anaerolineae bacterium]
MLIKLLSIVIFTFALGLVLLGAVTWWIEVKRRRKLGVAMVISGILIAVVYGFLGSRFAIEIFGRLVITVDLPQLMMTAIVYTLGVLAGLGLAGGVFLWISGRLTRPTRLEWQMGVFLAIILAIALVISIIAVQLS